MVPGGQRLIDTSRGILHGESLPEHGPAEELMSRLAGVEIVADAGPGDAMDLAMELVRVIESTGFVAERRAEGFALMPAGVNVPTHLRIGLFGSMVTVWVRGAYDLLQSAEKLGVSPEELFEALMLGARRAAEAVGRLPGGSVRVRVP